MGKKPESREMWSTDQAFVVAAVRRSGRAKDERRPEATLAHFVTWPTPSPTSQHSSIVLKISRI